MAFTAPSYEALREGILREIVSQLPDADIGSDSDNFVRSAAVSAVVEGLYQRMAWLYRQIFPDLADDEEVLHHAAIRGLALKSAVAAEGSAAITGTSGSVLPVGATVKHIASGEVLTTTESVTFGLLGAATVTCRAQSSGSALNGLAGGLLVTSPPLGVDATAVLEPLAGGVDDETVEVLRGRLLDIIRNQPAGGAIHDYERWALEVNGVSSVTVLPGRQGPGTVDVVITASDGAPSDEVLANCTAYIEERRPVTAEVFVYAPLLKTVDVMAQVELLDGYTLADVQAAAASAWQLSINALMPGENLKRSRIENLLGNLAGVSDRVVLTPTGNVAASDSVSAVGWIRPGALILGLMP